MCCFSELVGMVIGHNSFFFHWNNGKGTSIEQAREVLYLHLFSLVLFQYPTKQHCCVLYSYSIFCIFFAAAELLACSFSSHALFFHCRIFTDFCFHHISNLRCIWSCMMWQVALSKMLWNTTFHCFVIGAYCVDISELGGTKCLSLYCKPYAILYVCLLYLHRL